MPYHTPHWTTMVFHTGFCQSPLAVKRKMLKLDVICMGTAAIQRLISSLNSWTAILGGQPQELPDTGWNQARGSSGRISMGEKKKCLQIWCYPTPSSLGISKEYIPIDYPIAVVLNWGWFYFPTPTGDIWQSLETCLVVTLGRECYWHLVDRG